MSLKDFDRSNWNRENRDPSSSAHQARIAQSIISTIFRYTGTCLRENKSKKQLSLFTRSFIGGILIDKVLGGLNEFVAGMNEHDINGLLNEIQTELNKRR